MRILLALLVAFTSAGAGGAGAQTWTPRPGQPTVDIHRHQLESHRLEIDRLRLRADQRELAARQAVVESRLALMRMEAARQPDLELPAPSYPSATTAAEHGEAVRSATRQIDDWLNRRPN